MDNQTIDQTNHNPSENGKNLRIHSSCLKSTDCSNALLVLWQKIQKQDHGQIGSPKVINIFSRNRILYIDYSSYVQKYSSDMRSDMHDTSPEFASELLPSKNCLPRDGVIGRGAPHSMTPSQSTQLLEQTLQELKDFCRCSKNLIAKVANVVPEGQ